MGVGAFREDAANPAGAATVALLAWRYRGALRVTVIAKASFAFAHDAPMARAAPQEVFLAEVHQGKNPARSIRFASDRVPYLNRAEVLFTGHAYAPSGTTAQMSVRLGVFDGARALVDKSLRVQRKGGFQKVPLVYEGAYGGPGWAENPLGVGVLANSGEPEVVDPVDPLHLGGFAPIGDAWPARRRLLGVTPRKALQGDVLEIPEGFDWTYFQAAPADQRMDFLRGDEWILMEGLHPSRSLSRMRLPGATGLARVYGLTASGVADGQPLALHADVLRIDGDEERCTLTFRGVFPVADEAALSSVRVSAGVELPGEPIAWPALDEVEDAAGFLADEDVEAVPSLSFEGTLAFEDGRTLVLEDQRAPVFGDGRTLALRDEVAPAFERRGAMPFRAGPAPEAIAHGGGAAATPRRTEGETLELHDEAPAASLPFMAKGVPPPVGVEPLPAKAAIEEPEAATIELMEVIEAAPSPAPARAASPWAPAPEPAPPAPARPPPPAAQQPPVDLLHRGLYGRFGR